MRLSGTIAFISGASSGIGRACAEALAAEGARLLLIARRIERLKEMQKQLVSIHKTECRIAALDVRDSGAVQQYFDSLPKEWSDIDVLVNNAGLSRGLDKLQEGKLEDWEEMIDTNVKGLLYVTRYVLPGMVKRQRGTVINIGSIAGHEVYTGGNVYSATKHAVDAISRSLRYDLVDTPIRVCSVDPGLVETEFSIVRFRGDEERAKKVYSNTNPLTPEDVADAVVYCATRPAHVQVADMILLPTAQASATLVHRT